MRETKIFKHAKACRAWQERNAQKYLIQEIANGSFLWLKSPLASFTLT